MENVDQKAVEGFGYEWETFDQRKFSELECPHPESIVTIFY